MSSKINCFLSFQHACLTSFQMVRVNNSVLPQHDPNQQRRNEGIHLEKDKYYFSARVADAIPIMVGFFVVCLGVCGCVYGCVSVRV